MTTKTDNVVVSVPVGWIVLVALIVLAVGGFFFWLGGRGTTEELVAGTENLRPVSGTENLQLVNSTWDKQPAPVNAPVVVPPSVRSDFKAEYKITGPAAKEIEFKLVSSGTETLRWEIKTRTDKPLLIGYSLEQKDAAGNITENFSLPARLAQAKRGERIMSGDTDVFPETKKMVFWIEVKNAE